MAHDHELDGILSSLARPAMAGLADRLLDLRASAVSPADAGQCVKIYFELLAAAPENGALDAVLAALGGWLERKLSIEVLDEVNMEPLERLPLRLRGESDLGTFCQTAMRNFFSDRCHAAPRIRMQFGFVEQP
jgi:hypothetical protein